MDRNKKNYREVDLFTFIYICVLYITKNVNKQQRRKNEGLVFDVLSLEKSKQNHNVRVRNLSIVLV